ncbi:MAG: rod shape-determining protein RodA [Spirochaetota bacterium]
MKSRMSGSIRIDYLLAASFVLLTCIGIITIYSASSGSGDRDTQHIRQMYWAASAVVIFLAMLFADYQRLGEYALPIYLGGLVLLLLTLAVGTRIRGARSWINLFGGFGFQSSEFVKVAAIIALARFLEQIGEGIRELKNVVLALIIGLLPAGLILLQPDFGTALVYIPICLTMLYFAGIRLMHLLSLLIIFGIAGVIPLLTTIGKLTNVPALAFLEVLDRTRIVFAIGLMFGLLAGIMYLLYRLATRDIIFKATSIFLIFCTGLLLAAPLGKFLKPYQKERLVVFLNPSIDPFGAGYNIIQSKIAVGAGGITGRGLMGGSQSQLGFLPERSTDFIFSIFAEEWGFIGSLVLLGLFALFLYRCIMVMYHAHDRFGMLLASGIVGMFLFHLIVNIGMTIGIMPITGIPLPFLSYGGSFLVTCTFAVSLLVNIDMRRHAR